jgi:hypothetical protein
MFCSIISTLVLIYINKIYGMHFKSFTYHHGPLNLLNLFHFLSSLQVDPAHGNTEFMSKLPSSQAMCKLPSCHEKVMEELHRRPLYDEELKGIRY